MRLSSTTCSALVLLSLLALSCSSPEIEERASSGASIRLSISVPGQAPQGPSARLVVPETLPVIASWKVSLTRAVGDPVISIHEAGGASIAVSDIDPGTWDILVEGFSGSSGSGTRLASGSYPGAVLGLGATVSVSVSARYVSSGTGGFSFRLTFPSEAADTVRYTFNGVVYVPDVLMAAGQSSVLLSASDITPGTYPLGVELVKNGGVVRRLAESVVIVPNVVSTRWLSSNGSLADVRALETTDFADNEAGLVSVSFTKGNLDVSFGQSTFNYKLQNLTAHSVAVTAMTSSDMQSIKLYVNGLLQGTLRSGQMSAPFEAPHGADILLTVTAADGVTAKVYSFTVERDHLVTFDHQAIESGKRKITYESIPHGTPVTMKEPDVEKVQDGIKLKFLGWCTSKNGTGAILAHPTQVTITEPTTYYGIWSVLGGTGPAGGTVFYDKIVDNPSNPYADGWRYMELAKPLPRYVDPSFGSYWSLIARFLDTDSSIGSGYRNTVKGIDLMNLPMGVISDDAGGYYDWFIPSRDELVLAHQYLDEPDKDVYFWTSTESSATRVYCVNSEGTVVEGLKSSVDYIMRPCRMFSNSVKYCRVFYRDDGATSGVAPIDNTMYASGSSVMLLDQGSLRKDNFDFDGWETVFRVRQTPPITLAKTLVLSPRWKFRFAAVGTPEIAEYDAVMSTSAPIPCYSLSQLPPDSVVLYRTSQLNYGKLKIRSFTTTQLTIDYETLDSSNAIVSSGTMVDIPNNTFVNLDVDGDMGATYFAAADFCLQTIPGPAPGPSRNMAPFAGAKFYRVQ